MKQRSFTGYLELLPGWAFILLLFAYQLLFTFQGIDLADEGFNSIFFQQIYDNPDTVQYSFMFWLAGAVGGAFKSIFPDLGLWGFRLLGTIVTTGTIIVTYQLLKNYLTKGCLRLGLIFALLVISNNIKIFHYNYLCTLFFVITATLLFTGLRKDHRWRIFGAGAVVALEVFTRIPSLVNLGLVIAIFYHGFLYKVPLRRQLTQAIFFFAGFAASVVFVLLMMKLTGQLGIFTNALKLVVQMGGGGEGSHYGLSKLIKQFFILYGSSVKYFLIIALPVITAAVVSNFIVMKRLVHRKWLIRSVTALILITCLFLIVTDVFNHLITVFLFTNLALVAGLMIFTTGKNKDIQVLMLIGCYIVLTYPLGSSDGIYTVGVYALWIALPIAIDYFGKLRSGENHLTVVGEQVSFTADLFVTGIQLKKIAKYGIVVCLFACLYQAYYYPFFDTNDRIRMRYSIDNKYMKGIYTTKERADAINELLHESGKYVQAGDRVLAYHSIPMYHFMTETKPYLRNSMPWLYEGGFFSNELTETAKANPKLPVIIAQLTKTVGDASNWPDPPKKFDEGWAKVNEKRDIALKEFINTHQYKEVWRNSSFSILIPPGQPVDSLLSK